MSRFTSLVMAFVLAGCGDKFNGIIEIGQWTPDLTNNVTASGISANISDSVVDDDSFYTFDAAFFITGKSAQNAGLLRLGYFSHEYSGANTSAKYDVYKLAFDEPQINQSSQKSLHGGLIGLHVIDYDIDTLSVKWQDQAMMLVFGWGIEYESGGLMYYFKIEGMDLDVVTLGNVGGSFLETNTGLRYTFANSAALSVGYRDYDAELEIRDDKLNLQLAGTTVSFYMKF